MLAAQGGEAPVLLRIADPYAMAVVVQGVMAPPRGVSRLAASVLTRLRAAQADRAHVWVAGFDLDRPYPWGERAQALAGRPVCCCATSAAHPTVDGRALLPYPDICLDRAPGVATPV